MGDTTNDEQAKYGKHPKVIDTLDKMTRQYEDAKEGDQPKREPMLNYDWLGNMDDAARGYVDNLREPLRSDPVVAGIALEAFKAGRNLPALELAKANTMIDKGVLAVVKTAGIDAEGNCTECGWDADHRYPFSKYCPGCGAKIIEP